MAGSTLIGYRASNHKPTARLLCVGKKMTESAKPVFSAQSAATAPSPRCIAASTYPRPLPSNPECLLVNNATILPSKFDSHLAPRHLTISMRVLPDCCLVANESFSCGDAITFLGNRKDGHPWPLHSLFGPLNSLVLLFSSAHSGLSRKTSSVQTPCALANHSRAYFPYIRSKVFTRQLLVTL